MNIEIEKHCVLVNEKDLARQNLMTTAKTINANPDKIYLLAPDLNQPLHRVINLLAECREKDENGNDINVANMTGIKFAYELVFKVRTFLIDDTANHRFEAKSLSDILERLEYGENGCLIKSYQIILDDETATEEFSEGIPKLLSDLFQQIIFLNLELDIKLQSEIKFHKIKQKFRDKYEELKAEIERQQKKAEDISKEQLSADGKARIERITENLAKIPALMKKAQSRPIRIAAMGTKKAGKSVIINGFLGEEYAPTSSELPTPNVVTYIPAQRDEISLEYKGEIKNFPNPAAIREYIKKEYEWAQQHTGEGAALEDMIIRYPSKGMNNYEVMDTPGPNFSGAGEEHRKIAHKCIEKADICIFIMNYSSHLTNDEINFLKDIYAYFARENKFYSLFIAVNRIDERYPAQVEKSVNRIVDYIKYRLAELGYKNISLFGTSALQYFYLQKARVLAKQFGLDRFDETGIKTLKRNHNQYMDILKFIQDSLGNMEDFHNVAAPDDKTLEAMSGMPCLINYAKYIGEQKTDNEIVNHVIGEIDMEYSQLKNSLMITKLINLREQSAEEIERLKKLFQDVQDVIREEKSKVKLAEINPLELKGIYYEIDQSVKSNKQKLLRVSRDRVELLIDEADISQEKIEAMDGAKADDAITLLIKDMDEAVCVAGNKFTEDMNQVTFKKISMDVIARKEKILRESEEKIKKTAEEVRTELKTGDEAYRMLAEFVLPEVPANFAQMTPGWGGMESMTDKIVSDAVSRSYYERERRYKKSDRRSNVISKFFGWIGDFFNGAYATETITGHDVEQFKRQLKNQLNEFYSTNIECEMEKVCKNAKEQVTSVSEHTNQQINHFLDEYHSLFENIRIDIEIATSSAEGRIKELEKDIEVFKSVDAEMRPLFALWESIRSYE